MGSRGIGRLAFAAAFGAAVALAVAVLGFFAATRDESWTQIPITDCAVYHGDALEMLAALRDRGILGFADAWVSVNRTHTPLVPASSALLMSVFGTSRHVAEAVLPLFAWVLFASTCFCAESLYGRATAVASTLLFASFPVVLNLSRIYLYELPFAAMIVAACAAMIASEGFEKRGATLAFGAFAGLSALARAAGTVLVIGPVCVALWLALRAPDRGRRLANLALATALGLALAATWYVPNGKPLYDYLQSATYGDQAHIFAGGSSFSWENARIYILAIAYEGPGLPILAVTGLAFAAALLQRGAAALRSPVMLALGAAFALDFLVLMVAAQRCGAVLFVSVLPVIAIAAVRAVGALPGAPARVVLGGLLALLGAVNAWECSFTFPKETAGRGGGAGPFAPSLPLWSHRSMILDQVSYPAQPFADYRVEEIVARLEGAVRGDSAVVAVYTEHPYLSSYALRAEALRRGKRWQWRQAPVVELFPSQGEETWLSGVRQLSAEAEVLIARRTPWNEPPTRLYGQALAPLVSGETPRFVAVGEPIRLGDGSELTLYQRNPGR